MKEIIMVMDDDPIYSKKFCNQANKLYGKKYTFLTFANLKLMRKYAEDNKVESLVVTENFIENLDDVKVKSFYILNEKDKKTRREGKKIYVYKLQNVKLILDVIDSDLNKKFEKNKGKEKKRVLVLDLDEFSNYKGNVGLSNIIFDYKEDMITEEKLKKEIMVEKDIDFIKSVTYPEDFNVINNIDLANIVQEIVKLGYDFVFVNADMSYIKCQYLLMDADGVVIMKDKDKEIIDMFKAYLKTENNFDYKKITEFDVGKLDKAYASAFCKYLLSDKETE